jgi:shikimate kinase
LRQGEPVHAPLFGSHPSGGLYRPLRSAYHSAVDKPTDNIFLIGPMGAGKTTIGRQLARILKLEFIDSDHEIEQRAGADIPWIFDIEGEEGFRRRERAMIQELCQRRGIVLATGGGAVIDAENRRALAQNGLVVFLEASVDRIFDRTAKNQNRPLLQTENPRERIAQLLAERDPFYREIADIIVDTDRRGVRGTVNFILRHAGKRSATRARGGGKRNAQAKGLRA